MTGALSFIHRFIPAADPKSARTLLLLHGTGGNEDDLLSLGKELDPDANMLSPRGKVLENGMPRFFRRLAEGVFDLDDLRARTHELADFIAEAATHYQFDPARVTAVGYSNGANTGASLLLLRPESLAAGVLFRAMLPLELEEMPKLSGKRVLITGGEADRMISRAGTEKLAEVLKEAGASVTLAWLPTGHGLIDEDIRMAKEFLRSGQ